MDFLQRMGTSALGGIGGFLIGGPVGMAVGSGVGFFSQEISGAAKSVLGNPIGGSVAGGAVGGVAGFALGGPFGMLLGGMVGSTAGGLLGSYFQNQNQTQQYSQQTQAMNYGYYGSMGMGNFSTGSSFGMMGYGGMSGMGGANMFGCNYQMMMMMMQMMQMMQMMSANGSQGYWGYMGMTGQGGNVAAGQPGVIGGGKVEQKADKSINYLTKGGWNVNVDGTTIKLTDPSGKKTTKIWGDPHVKEADGSNWDWSSKTATFLLPDGTKITMNADSPLGVVKKTSIYDGGQEVQIDNSKKTFTAQYNPYQTHQNEMKQDDGKAYYSLNLGDDWKLFDPTKAVA